MAASLKEAWQHLSAQPIRPRIVVLTNQSQEVVQAGTKLPLIVLRDIRQIEQVQ